MQIYIMPDGRKRQFDKAPEGAVLFNPKPKKEVEVKEVSEEVKVEEKTVEEPQNKAVKPKNKAVKGSKKK